MLSILFATLVRFAILLGIALILGRSVAGMRSKPCRFALLFVLCLPLTRVVNYFDVRLAGYHKMGWTGTAVIALLLAAYGTFVLPQRANPNTT